MSPNGEGGPEFDLNLMREEVAGRSDSPGGAGVFPVVVFVLGMAVLVAACVTGLKGKWGVLVAGFFLSPLLWFVGAIRLAKPNSVWWRDRYGPEKQRRAVARAAEPVSPETVGRLAR